MSGESARQDGPPPRLASRRRPRRITRQDDAARRLPAALSGERAVSADYRAEILVRLDFSHRLSHEPRRLSQISRAGAAGAAIRALLPERWRCRARFAS